jgi:eukaryotic-like serine/threonine-protein kinase
MTLRPGDLLNNRYRIDEILAEGGMGAVYRAFDEILTIPVAVKENFFTTEDHIRQFRREATILADLRHHNLPRVTDHFSLGGQGQYLVMDFIEGEDLLHAMKQETPLPEEEVARIGAAVCDALSYLHTRQPSIIHRDIKPGNIKVTPSGAVYLVDFGLAKISHSGQNTTTGARALTPGYAPPEQYGEGTEPRSDIYSLGATLYAVLTGRLPEDGLSRAMGSSELTPLRKYNPAVSQKLARVIERAMEITPDARYKTATDFHQALFNTIPSIPQQQFPVPVPAIPAQPRDASTPDQNPGFGTQPQGLETQFPESRSRSQDLRSQSVAPPWVWLGSVGLVIVLVGIVFFMSTRGSTQVKFPATSTVVLQTNAPTRTETRLAAGFPATTTPLTALVGTPTPGSAAIPIASPLPSASPTPAATPLGGAPGQIAYSSSIKGLPPQVWIINSDGSLPKQVTNLPDGACQPDWSPDGSQIVFVSPCLAKRDTYPGSSLFIINASGTGLVPLTTLPGGDYDPAWSPNGKQIAFTSLREGRSNIFVYNLADNSVIRLSSPANYERRAAWSPDGKQIAYESNRSGSVQIWVMSAEGENARMFSDANAGPSSMPAWAPDNSNLIFAQGGGATMLSARPVNNQRTAASHLTEAIQNAQNIGFSPDGWWITFNNSVDNNDDIYILMRDGRSLTRLTQDASIDFHPSWRP